MKEEYVSYEQSQALKRLGFKEETTHYYVNFKSDGEIKLWSCNPPDNHNARLSTNEVCSAPRLDQAQKWLREVKKWIIYIVPEYDRIRHQCLWAVKHHPFTIASGLTELYTTYELALSAGIDAALELLTDKKRMENE